MASSRLSQEAFTISAMSLSHTMSATREINHYSTRQDVAVVIGQQRNVSASSEEDGGGEQQRKVASRRRSEGTERHGGQRDGQRMARAGRASGGATVRHLRRRKNDCNKHGTLAITSPDGTAMQQVNPWLTTKAGQCSSTKHATKTAAHRDDSEAAPQEALTRAKRQCATKTSRLR